MLKFRKKLLALLLTAAITASMSSVIAWSEQVPSDGDGASASQTEQTGDEPDGSGAASDDEAGALLTDEQGLAQMKKVAENDKFRLFLDEATTIFAVQSKADNYVWWSSPLNSESDARAKAAQKKNMQSPFYILYGDVKDHISQRLSAYEGSIKSKDFVVSSIDNGVRIDFTFSKINAVIPMTIVLEKDNVNVTILSSEIKEEEATDTSGKVLLNIGLMQFFAAAGDKDEGYIVVPDGSGAVINFNNKREGSQAYSNKVYGLDTSVTQLKRPAKNEQVYLPVIGNVIKGAGADADHGFLAIAESGDTCASVNAAVSGQNATSYNNTWFEFKVRTEDTYYMGNRKLTVYEAGNIRQPNLSVGFYPLTEKGLSYVDIAERYREYLIEEKGMTAKTDTVKSSYYLDVYGGTVKAQSILGFPVNMETAATTYAQAQEIMQKLAELGVDDIIVNYNDFNRAGINGLISAGVDYSGTLGGKGAYTDLSNYANSVNAKLFPSVGITYMKDSGNGYSYSLNACKQATKAYATTNNWDIAFGIPNQVRMVIKTTLSPYYWPDLYNKLTSDFKREGISTISLGNATTLLYSDFSRDNYTRNDTMNVLVDGYKKFKDEGFTLLANGANAYALPYVDYITNVPLTSSNYDVFDYDIPFYELVIHGLVPYTTKAINASANASDTILLALATATPVHYDMMYTDPNKFTDSDYDNLFYSSYKGWLDQSAQIYKLYKENLSDFTNLKITDYQRISADVIETTFEGGKTVRVDTRNVKLTVNGSEIDLAKYGLKGETNE